MAIALVTNGTGNSTTSDGFTTGSFDTTGANFLIVGVALSANSGALLDSYSNIWTPLTQFADVFNDRWIQLFYAKNATVGSGHTFSWSGTGNFPAICFAAFSGVDTSSPFDVENGNTNTLASSTTTGSVTPGSANELLITALEYDDGNTASIDSGFTITDQNPHTGFGWTGIAMAYLIETTATAKNPTWSWTSGANNAAAIATFKAGGAADVLMPQIWL